MRRLLVSFVSNPPHCPHLHYSDNRNNFKFLPNPKCPRLYSSYSSKTSYHIIQKCIISGRTGIHPTNIGVRLYCSYSSEMLSHPFLRGRETHHSTSIGSYSSKMFSHSYHIFRKDTFHGGPHRQPSSRSNIAMATSITSSTKKIVVVMGATGSGKSKLSIDLATRYFPAEIINSDKIQVSKGLNITTNKIPLSERRGVVHHLLGEYSGPELISPLDFRFNADTRISEITNRGKIPFVVGGSNSFIYALISNRFEPGVDFFDKVHPVQCVLSELRYNCCFVWIDVSRHVLHEYLDKRVDEMMCSGMYEELEKFFLQNGFSGSCTNQRTGLRKAIGVPEMEGYFRKLKFCKTVQEQRKIYEEAVREIKENTWQLAEKQVWKIQRLRESGWDLQRIDATSAFRSAMSPENDEIPARAIWENEVVLPSMKIVKHFLLE
ncbi:adenylate isopentenyltransferase [Capsicum galapagoense]